MGVAAVVAVVTPGHPVDEPTAVIAQGVGAVFPHVRPPTPVKVPRVPVTATELLRFGHSWATVHAIHAARPSPAHPSGRFLLTLTPKAYAGTGVQAVHPSQ
ncbi:MULTISPECIES: hypothetical protein [Streptomyces]|uniref:Uncharacterized protein n=1 Tax=Streptomyces flaveolus TaxID=67297 RepID=A0ABV3AQ27_9ACTN|nr:hypothetical protein [Streptomyces sp. NRRL F-3307]KMS87852.1 hypothetical protein ACZ91_29050 [Streptomyces regensis]KOG70416.1 hypothetical protein ADK77_12250 [Streptomyces antibioticus]